MRHFAACLAIMFFGFPSAIAARQSAMSPEMRQEVLNYQLTLERAEHLITALDAMTKYVVSLPDYQGRMAKMAKLSPAERLAVMEKDPGSMAILRRNDLTAREYSVGVIALRMSVLAAQGMASPNIVASPANVRFVKANLATLKPKLDAVDGMAVKK